MVRIPSQGGIDDYRDIVDALTGWMLDSELSARVITDAGSPVAVTCSIDSGRPGPSIVLDACLDTAGIGDPTAWTRPPLSGDIDDGWMHGRGASDSKAAVAIFSHLAAELDRDRSFTGRLDLLFDLDEHTGGFSGIKRYLADAGRVDGVMIGYPGTGKVILGGRGF